MQSDVCGRDHHPDPLAYLRRFLSTYRHDIWTVVLYAAFVGLLTLVTPIAVQAVVNTTAFGTLLQPLFVLVALLLLGLVVAGVLRALKSWVVEVLQRRVFVDTMSSLAQRLPNVDWERAATHGQGHIVQRYFDLFTLQKTSAALLLGAVDVVLAVGIGLIVLAFYHPVLLAFDALLLGALALLVFGLGRGGVSSAVEESNVKYEIGDLLAEVGRPGHAMGDAEAARSVRDRLHGLAANYLGARARHFRVVMRQYAGALLTQALASAGLLGLGGWLVIERELTLGQLVAAELIVTSVVSALSNLGKHIETYYDLTASVYKVHGLLELPAGTQGEGDESSGLADRIERREPSLVALGRPQRTRAVARVLGLVMVLFAFTTLLAPWQQSVTGEGRVVAYAPDERRQPIDAPVPGRLVRWYVHEGSVVREGDPIVEISDNDPLLVERLGSERSAVESKVASYEERLGSLALQVEAATAARRSEVVSAEAKLRSAAEKLRAQEQKLKAADATLETAMLNLGRVKALTERGLSAERDLELSNLAATKARTERDGAQADVLSATGDLDAARAALDKARAEGDAKIQEAEAKLRSGESDVADARASLARLGVHIARQQNQLVRAPRAGVVLQVLAVQGEKQVKQGDTLAILVPHTSDRAVELWVDGNDAAIVSEGRKVRLQFEGWPAVQFTGWPSVAVGSFGGVVSFVDAHDDGKGNFRVFIRPDPSDEPWPSPRFLRQGVRAKGWVLLEQVRLGFELWRRFNGFPPVLDDAPGPGEATSAKGGKT